MIRLFKNNEADFSHNETVLSEVISCKVTEEINEDYTMELEYPLEDTKNISSNLVTASIISIPTIDSRDNQQFRIIQKETNSNSITVQSQAKLLADLKENRIKAMTIVGKTRKEAIQIILDNALDPHNYKVGDLDTNTNTNVILEVKEGNLLSAIIGSENSVLSEYGGEFIVSNDTIDIVDQRGEDNGVVIEYGKNISSIKETINLTDLATVLIPKSGDYRLPEYSIESPLVGVYEKGYFKEVDLNLNIWDRDGEKGENQVTIEEAYTIMRDICNKMFTVDKVDQITFNYEVDFVELSKTEEYKNYAVLEKVNLGDSVTVRHKKLNLDLQGRVNKIAYRIDSEGNTSIDTVEIGFSKKQITDIIKDTAITANVASNKINQITETSTDGVTTELSKKAFKVTCSKASGTNVTIDAEGLTVNNGKILVKNSSGNTVFYVNTDGICNAVGGFVVEDDTTSCTITAKDGFVIKNDSYECKVNIDGFVIKHNDDECCYIDKDGIKITNENGYTSKVQVFSGESATLLVPDNLRVDGNTNIGGNLIAHKDAQVQGTLDVEKFKIGGENIESIIQDIVDASMPSNSSSGE